MNIKHGPKIPGQVTVYPLRVTAMTRRRVAQKTTYPRQVVLLARGKTDDKIRDISIAMRSHTEWGSPKTLHADGWKIDGCPVNGPAIVVSGSKGLVFWPTLVNEQMTLRYVLAESPAALLGDPPMHELQPPAAPSGRVDAAAWHDSFLLA